MSTVSRVRNRLRERGQSLAIVAVVLPAIVGLLALGLDATYLFVQHRLMQGAADLSALAGARSLPGDAAGADTRARTVATANGYPSGVTVTTPYSGDTSRIQVQISVAVRPFFLPALGVQTVDVTVLAVARSIQMLGAQYAIFAGEVNCGTDSEKSILWSGSKVKVTGSVVSNGGATVSGSNNSVTGATHYYCPNRFYNTGSGNTYVPTPVRDVQSTAWPFTFAAASFPCTYSRAGTFDLSSDGVWWVGGTKASKQLRPGVYCATGGGGIIKLSDSGITGTVTFVAGYQVEISGSNFTLNPYSQGVLAFAQGNLDTALKLSGSGGAWTGILYAPNGQVELSGSSNLTIVGGIVAGRVKIGGSDITIQAGASQSSGPAQLQLVE
jgi:hypothetical protein